MQSYNEIKNRSVFSFLHPLATFLDVCSPSLSGSYVNSQSEKALVLERKGRGLLLTRTLSEVFTWICKQNGLTDCCCPPSHHLIESYLRILQTCFRILSMLYL